jgi:two-component system sensor histidine kinase YesM
MTERSIGYQLSMRYRFMFVFFILIVLPFALVGYIALSKSEETIQITNRASIVQTGKNLDYFFRYVLNEQDKLMASDEMQALFSAPQKNMDEITYADKLLSYADTVNYSNKLFKIRLLPLEPAKNPTYMRSAYGRANIENEAWFTDIVEQGRSFWKVFSPADHPSLFVQPTFSSVKRLHSLKSFNPIGVVIMDIRPSVLADFIYPVKQFQNQKIMLLSKDNHVIYSTDEKYGNQELDQGLKKALLDPLVSKTIQYNGKESLVNTAVLFDSELKLASITPTKDLNNPVSILNKLTLSFLIFYFLLAIFLVGYLTVKYTGPISALVRHMKLIARNNFNETSIADSKFATRRDEVGWLYRGMHNMISEIHKLLKETKNSEKRKKQLEFKVLAYQINPHFLYNTLDTIRWKAEAHHIDEISEIVTSLSTLFRLSLNRGKEFTQVDRELELLKSYIQIERARHSSPIRVTFMIEEEILALPIMRLILQPLVENAIRHGIADKGDAGIIIIQGTKNEDSICFKITDNGPGIADDVKQTLFDPLSEMKRESEGGVGLINVHERLRLYFGEPYGLEVESELNRGTTIVLLHPILPENTTELE